MDINNPDWVTKQLMKVDPAIFYAFMKTGQMAMRVADFYLDAIFGFTLKEGTRNERWLSNQYNKSAQLVNVIGRGTFSILYNHQLHNYLYTHNRYIHPEYILQNDNITLHGCTPTHAFFCVSKYDVYDPVTYPFTFLLQFLQSNQLIIVPHSTFHKLAETVGDPTDRKVTLLNMTARCGSTLVGQMLSRVPNVRVISEPWVFMHLHGFYIQRLISLPQYQALLKSALRLQCKKEKINCTHLFIKMSNFAGPCFPFLKQLFPNIDQMFITRHVKDAHLSYTKVMRALPQLWYLLGRTYDFWQKHLSFPADSCEWWDNYDWFAWKHNYEEGIAFALAGSTAVFLGHKEDYVHSMLYEDIRANPRKECEKLLVKMGLSLDYVDRALEALKTDSQAGIPGFGSKNKVVLTPTEIKNLHRIFTRVDTPLSFDMTLDQVRKMISLDDVNNSSHSRIVEMAGDGGFQEVKFES